MICLADDGPADITYIVVDGAATVDDEIADETAIGEGIVVVVEQSSSDRVASVCVRGRANR